MKLHTLLRSCLGEDELRLFLADTFDVGSEAVGTDVWDSTDGPWKTRVFDIARILEQRGLADVRLFEVLAREIPNRADDIAAACRTTTGQKLSYASGNPPPANSFPWPDYRDAMSPGLQQMLGYAAYDARSRNYATISTSEIVRVYLALQPWTVVAFGSEDPKTSKLERQEDPFDGTLGASYCVSKTIHGLAANVEKPQRYDEHDVFLDLVRFGNGKSVGKLVPDGDSLEQINAYSRRLKVGRITRHAVLDDVAIEAD